MGVIVVALNGGLFDGSVHALHLSIGPRMVGFRQAMVDTMTKAEPVEGMPTKASRWSSTVLG